MALFLMRLMTLITSLTAATSNTRSHYQSVKKPLASSRSHPYLGKVKRWLLQDILGEGTTTTTCFLNWKFVRSPPQLHLNQNKRFTKQNKYCSRKKDFIRSKSKSTNGSTTSRDQNFLIADCKKKKRSM